MEHEFRAPPRLRLHGWSPESPARIFERVAQGAKPSSLKGDFVLVAEGAAANGQPLTMFVSTVVAAVPYFFTPTDSHCVHGLNVFDCCHSAGLPWRWNWDALAQLVMFEHVLGDRSLHASIARVPAASVVRVCGTEVAVETESFWADLHAGGPAASAADAPGVLLEILGELPANTRCSLSLSAGYDSRLLLAGLTHLKREVSTACMGGADSTDPRIAAELARIGGCDFRRIELEAADYVASADEIVTATSGEKILWHWHTGIYAAKSGFARDAIHLAGSNGEFARSYFFDKGWLAEGLDASGFSRWDSWLAAKNARRRRVSPAIDAALASNPEFDRALDARRQIAKVFVPGMRFGDGLDYFYAAERVRNFIGLGLALYRSQFPTMSPFLDARFIRCAARLPRREKLADRLPRAAIGALAPRLLDLPANESGVPMRSSPGAWYFLKHPPSNAYQRHGDAHRLPEVATWARDGFRVLSGRDAGSDPALVADVSRWNHAMTVGATLAALKRRGIRIA